MEEPAPAQQRLTGDVLARGVLELRLLKPLFFPSRFHFHFHQKLENFSKARLLPSQDNLGFLVRLRRTLKGQSGGHIEMHLLCRVSS